MNWNQHNNHNSPSRRVFQRITLAIGIMLCVGAPALGMAEEPQQQTQVTVISSGSSTTTTTAMLVLIAFNPLISSTSSTSSTTGETLFGSKEATHQYVANNSVGLQQDITTGGGKTVTDMAKIAKIPNVHHAAFGKMLRKNRVKLMELLQPQNMNKDRAYVFALYIEEVMSNDATLQRYTPAHHKQQHRSTLLRKRQ